MSMRISIMKVLVNHIKQGTRIVGVQFIKDL